MEALVLCIFALSLRGLVRHELVCVLEGPQAADRFDELYSVVHSSLQKRLSQCCR
jgi:hypothetical protein